MTQTYLKVEYQCDGPRQRFRPFSNKRYDEKFSPSAFHHVRHPSNNRFVAWNHCLFIIVIDLFIYLLDLFFINNPRKEGKKWFYNLEKKHIYFKFM